MNSNYPEWQHKFVASKPYLESTYGGSRIIKVEAGLRYINGNSSPYFSVTGEIGRPKARDCDTCGCLHDEILKYWPDLAPIVALHLSHADGLPMHAEANGWYDLAGYYGGAGQEYYRGNSKGHFGGEYRFPTPDECLQIFADHVRVPPARARELADGWKCDDDPKASRRSFAQWLDTQAGRFAQEAQNACDLLDRLIEQQGRPHA